MSDFTIEQLEALKEGTIPGPWAAITDYPYISIVIASDIDQIHAPIVDIKDGTTDEPEVDKHHELMAAAPELVDALIAEKRAHQALRSCLNDLRGAYGEEFGANDEWNKGFEHAYKEVARDLARILEADNG